jgi:hypothetical protein
LEASIMSAFSSNENIATVEPLGFGLGVGPDQRRTASRVPRAVPITLSSAGGPDRLSCTAEDISEDGLYLRVPADLHLCVGQRCELNFSSDPRADVPPTLMGGTCYATVVRTEQLIEPGKPLIGAGLRFDQPIYL